MFLNHFTNLSQLLFTILSQLLFTILSQLLFIVSHSILSILLFHIHVSILFKVKQQHTGEHMKPSRYEPAHDSPGNQAEKNQHRIAQETNERRTSTG